jgi:hypothetical protein
MPCGLEDRARFFPRLDSLRQKTPGYFDAPATGLAPLGARRGAGEPGPGAAFPETTVVFCTIDKWAAFGRARAVGFLPWPGPGWAGQQHRQMGARLAGG